MSQANVPTTELSNLTDILVTNTAPSFAVGSIITASFFGHAQGISVTVQADDKILLGGTVHYSQDEGGPPNSFAALMRYNSNGSLDTSFGIDGSVRVGLGGYRSPITVQADGKILMGETSGGSVYSNDGGYFVPTDFTLIRFNTDGSPDTGFDGDGKVTTNLGSNDYGNSITTQADGKILLGGTAYNNGSPFTDFALVRYNSDGSLDLSFDGDGIVTTDLVNLDDGNSITLQADGKILLGGISNGNYSVGNHYSNYDDFTLVRYNTDGSLDTGFGIDGIVTTAGGSGESVTVQADGKILLGGTTALHFNYLAFALVRYNSDGSLDNSFNHVNTLDYKAYYIENSTAVYLDDTVQIYDAELAAQGNYNGASITLARHGGANAEDIFSGSNLLSFDGGNAVLSGVTLGTVSNSNGTLSINFNSDATQERVDAVLSAITYRNPTDYPLIPANTSLPSVQIDWTFSDGNTGTQGTGDALTTTGSSIINILASYNYNEFIGTTKNDRLSISSDHAGKIYGFFGNDQLNGGGGNDTLDGGKGNDRLDGRAGTDSMLGGLGNDSYRVDNESDSVIEKPDEGTDTIICTISYNLPANVENLTLTGSQSINGKGNELANTLIGNAQDNRLSGGAGADTLSGGLGADTFKFNKATETGITEATCDTLIDFSHDQGDKINLAIIDANTALKGNAAFTAPTVGGAFSGTFANPGDLYFDQSTNILYGNNDADSTADFSIRVMGVNSLVAADFVL